MITKSILKWVGGKASIIDKVMGKFPNKMKNYHEIFVGGGSVLLELLNYKKLNKIKITGTIYAYDYNRRLIDIYKCIQTNHIELYNRVMEIMEVYRGCDGDIVNRSPITEEQGLTSRESYYYWLRREYNRLDDENVVNRCALFIVLNKLCFRGLYREGPNGFNVPYGHYRTVPNVMEQKHIEEIAELIKDVKFECLDFEESIKLVKRGDFVYMDPPYVPENKDSFVGYTKDGFNESKHDKLFGLIRGMNKQGIKYLMSNSHTDKIRENFRNNIEVIECRRAINSKNPASKTEEVLVKNFN